MRSLERVNIRTNERTYVRTYSHTYVRDRPYIPSTTLLCEGIKKMLLLFLIRVAEHHLFGKELFIRFAIRVFRERLLIFVYALLSLLVLRVECGI